MTPWVYLHGLVHEDLRVIHIKKRKVRPRQCGPSEENKNKLLTFLIFIYTYKYFLVSVGTDLYLSCLDLHRCGHEGPTYLDTCLWSTEPYA
jgi:hypothetical protein